LKRQVKKEDIPVPDSTFLEDMPGGHLTAKDIPCDKCAKQFKDQN